MTQQTIHYADVIAEWKTGAAHGVFVDDTGSPGQTLGDLHPHRKSWVGSPPPHLMIEVVEQLPKVMGALREGAPRAREFHFTDILAGKNDFANVDLQIRLAAFRFMAWLFAEYRFPVFVQTLDPQGFAEVRHKVSLPDKYGPLRLSDYRDFALVFLLWRIRSFLAAFPVQPASAWVFVDEGRLKNGSTIYFRRNAPLFREGIVSFGNSKTVLPLQLADFAAFALNRWQILRNKEQLSELDKLLLGDPYACRCLLPEHRACRVPKCARQEKHQVCASVMCTSNPSLERTRGSVVGVRLTPSFASASGRAAQLRR